jgi:hypothetical protein
MYRRGSGTGRTTPTMYYQLCGANKIKKLSPHKGLSNIFENLSCPISQDNIYIKVYILPHEYYID